MILPESLPLSPKQLEFITHKHTKWNLAHGSVRTGKTVGTLFAFLYECFKCPDSQIFMVGHSSDTIYQNVVRLIFETPEFIIFKPFCTWSSGKRQLKFMNKSIQTLGAKDEGAIGSFQGKTMSLCLCDEMTLYPESIINMIDTRLSNAHSMGFASMNPSHPEHTLKKWIDKAQDGDPNYYELHFTLEDNPFVDQAYKDRIKNSTYGVFHKRNYLGLWCSAEGAIFDFFDKKVHVLARPPAPQEYWIAGIDYGVSNAFCCLLIAINTGQATQTGKRIWVEKEYYWDCKKTGRQKINSEFADDIQEFLEPYAVRGIYMDPSALSMKLELQKRGMHVVAANNDVYEGIQIVSTEMGRGNLFISPDCPNLIREIQSYTWDSKKSDKGEDAPVKKADHAVDGLRYAIATHKVSVYDPYKHRKDRDDWFRNRYDVTR